MHKLLVLVDPMDRFVDDPIDKLSVVSMDKLSMDSMNMLVWDTKDKFVMALARCWWTLSRIRSLHVAWVRRVGLLLCWRRQLPQQPDLVGETQFRNRL